MLDVLLNMPHSAPSKDINYVKIPCHILDINDEGMILFNSIVDYINSLSISKIKRTPSGGISNEGCSKYRERYDIRALRSMIEITLILRYGCWRIQFRNSFERIGEEQGISGTQAFWKFSNVCSKHGINILDYKLKDVEQAHNFKKSTEPYIKKVLSSIYLDKPMDRVHHIDFNSSFMAGLCRQYPEFNPVGTELYMGRKENPIYKGVMTNVIGYFGSEFHKCAWAHLRKAAVNGNNEMVWDLVNELRENNRVPILINTDGIWYTGDIYHNQNEGISLGNWKHDHIDCKILIKSPACYQYLENGKIHTVMSGRTKLDLVKPRELWGWGDIYRQDVKVITYVLENGKIKRREE